ncbi:hypothetical protein CR513_26779, partial [Mucuna pruriens]
MSVVANIFALPTLSFAHKTLGTCTSGKATKNLSEFEASSEKGPLMYNQVQVHGRRSQEPHRGAKFTYLVKPSNDRRSRSSTIQIERLEDDVNKLAATYIIETRNKICTSVM